MFGNTYVFNAFLLGSRHFTSPCFPPLVVELHDRTGRDMTQSGGK